MTPTRLHDRRDTQLRNEIEKRARRASGCCRRADVHVRTNDHNIGRVCNPQQTLKVWRSIVRAHEFRAQRIIRAPQLGVETNTSTEIGASRIRHRENAHRAAIGKRHQIATSPSPAPRHALQHGAQLPRATCHRRRARTESRLTYRVAPVRIAASFRAIGARRHRSVLRCSDLRERPRQQHRWFPEHRTA